jgi:hypothetical protein
MPARCEPLFTLHTVDESRDYLLQQRLQEIAWFTSPYPKLMPIWSVCDPGA